MSMFSRKYLYILVCCILMPLSSLLASDETYIQTLSGKIKKGDSCVVVDEKFQHLKLEEWNALKNESVINVITFEMRKDTNVFYQSKPFTCTLNVTIQYFSSKDQQTPTEINDVKLKVNYDTATGKFYSMADEYRFKNAFKVIVIVKSIASPEWGDKLPAVFRIKNQIVVNRKYPFSPIVHAAIGVKEEQKILGTTSESITDKGNKQNSGNEPAAPDLAEVVGKNKITISWQPADFGYPASNPEEYDVEWTYIDRLSTRGDNIATNYTSGTSLNIPDATVAGWMRNDNTRVTIKGANGNPLAYTINLPYTDGYILVRVRSVSYDGKLRLTSNWQYRNPSNTTAGLSIAAHQENLNWQYTGAFAEDGKKKEVISYFDGALRGRQTVTINNSDNIAVAAETIYDNMGRPSANILPAPILDNTLKFYPALNKNASNQPYSQADILPNGCKINAGQLSTSSGASQYYSTSNNFLTDPDYSYNYSFTKFVPDATGYPIATTQYMPDNTGRVRRQGGVGPDFQIGTDKETQYYYGKPTQRDLDRLFGVEVGNASHYLKNMVVDPNGQVSVSYVDANGKTIATALAGGAPSNLDAIPSANAAEAKTNMLQPLMQSADFAREATSLSMEATSTFLAATKNVTYTLYYSVNPASLTNTQATSGFCSNCYYDVDIKVKDACGNPVAATTSTPFLMNNTTCGGSTDPVTGTLAVPINTIGEYYVTYTLKLSKDAIKYQEDYYIANNTQLKKLQTFFNDELAKADLSGCYSDCATCKEKLGLETDFAAKMNALFIKQKNEKYGGYTFDPNDTATQRIIHDIYTNLYNKCANNCVAMSPCDQKLSIMKSDVMPGGQYALYTYDETTDTYAYIERDINVMRLYNTTVPDINFLDDDGMDKFTHDLSESDFIRAYIKHPEWADQFVLQHIEYCAYQFCTANPSVYVFDQSLRDITKGQDAVDKNYFDVNRTDIYILVNADPFFSTGGLGATYKTDMMNDLAGFTTKIDFVMQDGNGNVLPAKNIGAFVDWMLYCKPASTSATAADVINSWSSCSPALACRSLNREWELFRNYYLRLKGVYEAKARAMANPNCKNCFIGTEVINTCGDGGGVCPSSNEFYLQEFDRHKTAMTPCIAWEWEQLITHSGGAVTRRVTVKIKKTETFGSYTYVTSHDVVFEPGDFQLSLGIWNSVDAGAFGECVKRNYQFEIVSGGTSCGNTDPASTCPSDPLYASYQNKKRVFDEYYNEGAAGECLMSTLPTVNNQADANAAIVNSVTAMRTEMTKNLNALKLAWKDKLTAVRDEEFPSLATDPTPTLSDAVIDNLINNLGIVAQKYIDIADANSMRIASTLPAGVTASNGYSSFSGVFNGLIGSTLVQQGFGEDLLETPYPYDKIPVSVSPNIADLSNANVCSNVADFKTRWQNSGSSLTFPQYLKQELGDDYIMTDDEIQDLQTRCTQGCQILNNPVVIPTAFAVPATERWKDCSTITAAITAFKAKYSSVTEDSRLFMVLLPNYLNHLYGYSLSYTEYKSFTTGCAVNNSLVLYNKPGSPAIPVDDFDCAAGIITGVFNKAGQAYEDYIVQERIKFRNNYVSTCLATTAKADIQMEQYEYHYTLYYYDQSGNLVKTVPPEGVRFLSNEELSLVDAFRNDDAPSACTYTGPEIEDKINNLNAVSTKLQTNAARSIEMWLYGTTPNTKQVRIITPDNKYMYQAAIYDRKIWVELYSLEPGTGGDISITASSQVYADISSLPALQDWNHLVVQPQAAGNLLTDGSSLDLYLDGHKLIVQNSGATMPSYPFDWEINAGYTLPAENLSYVKHLRVYNRNITAAEIDADYKSGCLMPQGDLANTSTTQLVWARFNVPAPGSETTVGGPTSTTEYARRFIVPEHGLPTNYVYNSVSQVVQQTSPDAGTSKFWYDRLARLAVSQNAQQADENKYSYTKYDLLGRIVEVGEKTNPSIATTEANVRDDNNLGNWLNSGSNAQVTITAYDEQPAWVPTAVQSNQYNLRKRVAATALLSAGNNGAINRTAASYYSYDINGNVDVLVQENSSLVTSSTQYVSGDNGLKKIEYEYDLVSGKVNKVKYENGRWDAFYYRYTYDADNRITGAYSNINNDIDNSSFWQQDAGYRYYLHGPLARVQLGKDKVQGLDYAYTLQGWLKGVNSSSVNALHDMGNDGGAGANMYVARDAFGFALHYFGTGDYMPINAVNPFAAATGIKALYNGNIVAMTANIPTVGEALQYRYNYDQLNRLTQMQAYRGLDVNNNIWNLTAINDFKENISYDGNGNILTYKRNGNNTFAGKQLAMDDLSYGYNVDNNGRLVNNKLRHVKDAVTNNEYTEDLENQPTDNYTYDKIGNLVKDLDAQLSSIEWTVYGKIKKITKNDNSTIEYEYDAAGNRISKKLSNGEITYYVRDAQGNVLGIYGIKNSIFSWQEQHLYGSSRLGAWKPEINPSTTNASSVWALSGKKFYELSNHLGNVLTTISDKLVPHSSDGVNIDYSNADVISATDYYPFGMQMVGRSFNGGGYRYGFNGKENDNEVKGISNEQDYGMRIYDPRVGKFLSVDPLTKDYPWYTPYQFAGNSPICYVDLDGLEPARPSKPGEVVKGTNGNGPGVTWESDGNGGWREQVVEAASVTSTKRSSWRKIGNSYKERYEAFSTMFKQDYINGINPFTSDRGEEYRLWAAAHARDFMAKAKAAADDRAFSKFMVAYMATPFAIYGGVVAAPTVITVGGQSLTVVGRTTLQVGRYVWNTGILNPGLNFTRQKLISGGLNAAADMTSQIIGGKMPWSKEYNWGSTAGNFLMSNPLYSGLAGAAYSKALDGNSNFGLNWLGGTIGNSFGMIPLMGPFKSTAAKMTSNFVMPLFGNTLGNIITGEYMGNENDKK